MDMQLDEAVMKRCLSSPSVGVFLLASDAPSVVYLASEPTWDRPISKLPKLLEIRIAGFGLRGLLPINVQEVRVWAVTVIGKQQREFYYIVKLPKQECAIAQANQNVAIEHIM